MASVTSNTWPLAVPVPSGPHSLGTPRWARCAAGLPRTQVNGAVEREIPRLRHDSILPHPGRDSTACPATLLPPCQPAARPAAAGTGLRSEGGGLGVGAPLLPQRPRRSRPGSPRPGPPAASAGSCSPRPGRGDHGRQRRVHGRLVAPAPAPGQLGHLVPFHLMADPQDLDRLADRARCSSSRRPPSSRPSPASGGRRRRPRRSPEENQPSSMPRRIPPVIVPSGSWRGSGRRSPPPRPPAGR